MWCWGVGGGSPASIKLCIVEWSLSSFGNSSTRSKEEEEQHQQRTFNSSSVCGIACKFFICRLWLNDAYLFVSSRYNLFGLLLWGLSLLLSCAACAAAPSQSAPCDVVCAFSSGFLHSMSEKTAIFQRKSRFRLPFLIYSRQVGGVTIWRQPRMWQLNRDKGSINHHPAHIVIISGNSNCPPVLNSPVAGWLPCGADSSWPWHNNWLNKAFPISFALFCPSQQQQQQQQKTSKSAKASSAVSVSLLVLCLFGCQVQFSFHGIVVKGTFAYSRASDKGPNVD